MIRVIILLSLSISAFAQQNQGKIRTKGNLPVDVISAVRIMDKSFSEEEKLKYRSLTKDSIISYFRSEDPGDFRYNWISLFNKKNPIIFYFNNLGIFISYDIYKAITISFHNYINNKPIALEQTIYEIKHYREQESKFYQMRNQMDTVMSIEKWKSVPVPSSQDVEDKKYGFDSIAWHVYKINNQIYVNKGRRLIGSDSLQLSINDKKDNRKALISDPQKILMNKDGYLVGVNQGEWGGALYWISADKKKTKKVSDHQIVQIIQQNDNIYAIEGLSHLGSSTGSIITIRKVKKSWKAQEYIKLPSAPFGIHIDSPGHFIVGTGTGILYIKEQSVNVLVEGFWRWGMYPNSMVILNEDVYIGMRKGVYKYNLTTGKQEWLMPVDLH